MLLSLLCLFAAIWILTLFVAMAAAFADTPSIRTASVLFQSSRKISGISQILLTPNKARTCDFRVLRESVKNRVHRPYR
jgi:hypothetical protein